MLDSIAASLAATLQASFWPGLTERAVLVLNHLLRAQDGALQRLLPHVGKSLRIDWQGASSPWPRLPTLRLLITPAGLFEIGDVAATDAAADALPGLRIAVDLPSPLELPRMLAEGRRPATRIEGDTDLAADLAWLADHLRWDAEHDFASVVGDGPARMLVTSAQAVIASVRGFAVRAARSPNERKDGDGDTAAAPR